MALCYDCRACALSGESAPFLSLQSIYSGTLCQNIHNFKFKSPKSFEFILESLGAFVFNSFNNCKPRNMEKVKTSSTQPNQSAVITTVYKEATNYSSITSFCIAQKYSSFMVYISAADLEVSCSID